MAQSPPATALQAGSDGGAYARALASLCRQLSAQGLLELTVWHRGGAHLSAIDRATPEGVERDVFDAGTAGRPEGAAIDSGRTQLEHDLVAAPIAFEGQTLGALSARFSSPMAAVAARDRVEDGAQRLAALLEVARLTRSNATAGQDWETVVAALQSIAGGTDLHEICDAVRRHLMRAMTFDCLVVARVDQAGDELEAFYLYESGFPRRVSIRVPRNAQSPGPIVAATGLPLIFRHTADWERFGASQLDDDGPRGGRPTSAIFIPLRSGATTLGVASLQAAQPGGFGDRERALLEPIAEGLALAVARSQLQHQSDDARAERAVAVEVAHALARSHDLPTMFATIWEQTRRLVDSADFYVALVSRDGKTLEMAYHLSGENQVPLTEIDVPSPRMVEVFRTGRSLICNDRTEMAAHGIGPEVRPDLQSVAIVPMRAGDAVVGVMNCGSPRERAYPPSRADLLIAIGQQAGVAVNNARLFQEAAERSSRDPLTDLLNHRAIMVTLQRLLAERDAGVAAVLLDIESFRLFNATFGHHVGDEALRLVSECIRRAVSSGDWAARYGGDEFLVVIREGGAAAAQAFLERLRAELLAMPLDSPSGVPIPVSFCAGTAVAPHDGVTREALVSCADQRLQAERSGTHARTSHPSGRNHPTLSDVQEGLLVAILRKDLYTRSHIHFVGELALDFAAALRLDVEMTRALFLGSLLHDVGKICVPDAIISKPSALTSAERKLMERHTTLGYELVRGIDGMEIASLAVLHHHERIDGRGYSFGLAAGSIPAVARMVTIIDAFSAMVLDRPYHKAVSDDEAMAELRRCSGTQFDAEYVSVFTTLFTP